MRGDDFGYLYRNNWSSVFRPYKVPEVRGSVYSEPRCATGGTDQRLAALETKEAIMGILLGDGIDVSEATRALMVGHIPSQICGVEQALNGLPHNSVVALVLAVALRMVGRSFGGRNSILLRVIGLGATMSFDSRSKGLENWIRSLPGSRKKRGFHKELTSPTRAPGKTRISKLGNVRFLPCESVINRLRMGEVLKR